MSEEKISKEFEQYRELAKQDKKIDVASLMISALQKHEENRLSQNQKRWAYLISLLAPPFGLVFAVKFYLSGKEDGESAAWMCGVLTAIGILLLILFGKILFSGVATNLKQVDPKALQELIQ